MPLYAKIDLGHCSVEPGFKDTIVIKVSEKLHTCQLFCGSKNDQTHVALTSGEIDTLIATLLAAKQALVIADISTAATLSNELLSARVLSTLDSDRSMM